MEYVRPVDYVITAAIAGAIIWWTVATLWRRRGNTILSRAATETLPAEQRLARAVESATTKVDRATRLPLAVDAYPAPSVRERQPRKPRSRRRRRRYYR